MSLHTSFESLQLGEFTFHPLPSITSVEPLHGSLKMSNAYFAKNLRCRFGQDITTPAKLVDPSTVLCHAPEVITERSERISITFNGVDFHRGCGDCCTYHYVKSPFVSSIRPSEGYAIGGTRVRLFSDEIASNLEKELICQFGPDNQIAPVFIGSNFVDCVSPAVPPGIREHRVSLRYGIPLCQLPLKV